MAKFPITEAQQELDFLPATGVRANIDVDTGAGVVGAAIGQAALAVGEAFQKRSVRRAAIEARNRKNLDSQSALQADLLRKQRDVEIDSLALSLTPEQKEESIREIVSRFSQEIESGDFSPEALNKEMLRNRSDLITKPKQGFIDSTRALSASTVKLQTEKMVEEFRKTGGVGMGVFLRDYSVLMKENGVPTDQITLNIKTAKETGDKLRAGDAANAVYAAIELASKPQTGTGDFTVAKELATNPDIPESRQATLRSAINTAETAERNRIDKQQRDLEDKTTSDTIRESYQGTLTIGELDRRHAAGLIRDPAFESMRKGLAEKIPDISDPMVRSEMSNAITQFKANQISREDALNVFLSSLPFLDEPDRKKFDNDIEKVTTLLVETAMSEAKDAGKELISLRFQKFDPFGVKIFTDPEDERRFNLEWRLRNQYNDELDIWKEAQKDKVITPTDVRRIENDLLIDYRKIRSRGLDAIEEAVGGGQGPPVPLQEVKTLRSISIERLKARREGLRRQLK